MSIVGWLTDYTHPWQILIDGLQASKKAHPSMLLSILFAFESKSWTEINHIPEPLLLLVIAKNSHSSSTVLGGNFIGFKPFVIASLKECTYIDITTILVTWHSIQKHYFHRINKKTAFSEIMQFLGNTRTGKVVQGNPWLVEYNCCYDIQS